MSAPLSTRGLDVSAGARLLVGRLDLDLVAGEIVCVLGVNGAGKTTTLETLCGLRGATAGSVTLDGDDVATLSRPSLARRIGLMSQRNDEGFANRVLPLVAMGRHAHKRFWEWQDADDLAAARGALARVDLAGFEDRGTATLSAGERQRLDLALLLVQNPRVMLLDEPLSQLDPRHQQLTVSLLRALSDDGRALIVSVHDVNLAARLADRVLLLAGDGRWQCGGREAMLDEDTLSELYGTRIRAYRTDDGTVYSAVS